MGQIYSIMGHLCRKDYIAAVKLDVTKMMYTCKDCDASISIPDDVAEGEIIGCGDCGLDYIVKNDNGCITIQELAIEGEDWGE